MSDDIPETSAVASFAMAAIPGCTGAFPMLPPSGQAGPYATYSRQSTNREYSMEGVGPATTPIIRIISWSLSYAGSLAGGAGLVAAAHEADQEVIDEKDVLDFTPGTDRETWYGRVVDIAWPYSE